VYRWRAHGLHTSRAGRRYRQRRCVSGSRSRETGLFTLFVSPGKESSDELEDLEFLGVGAIQGKKMEEMVRNELSE